MNNKKWYACELHCHTLHSDGDFTVPELITAAKNRRLDGICLTDHNTSSGWDEAKDDTLAILKGIEWTTYFGHMKVLDCSKYVDWRDAQIHNIDEKIAEVKENGGIVGIAHPFQVGTPLCTGGHWDYKVNDWQNVSYIEIWSEGCPYLNNANLKAIAMWHSLLNRGYKITPTFGRDWHRLRGNVYESACTYLLCDDGGLTDAQMKAAIEKGKTVVSVGVLFYAESAEGETIGDIVSEGERTFTFTVDTQRIENMGISEKIIPEKIKVISGGEVIAQFDATQSSIALEMKKNCWYSFELWGSIDENDSCMLAATGAVYCE